MAISKDTIDEIQQLNSITTYQAGVLQSAAHRSLNKFISDILSEFDITAMQWFIIGTVLDAGTTGIRTTDLSKTLGTNIPFLTNTINLLAKKKILRKMTDPTDNRATLVSVKKSYISQCEHIETTMRDAMRVSIYSVMEPYELLTYIRVLSKLRNI